MALLMTLPQNLEDLARAKWRSSGISDEQAAKLQFESKTGAEIAQLGHNFKKLGGVLLPYFHPDGSRNEFFRFRYLEEPTGFAAQIAKKQRYEQPIGTLNDVYLPPLLTVPWATILANPNLPIIITEGEFKAASACAHGVPTIGLGGVDVWRAKKRGIDLLPTLANAEWSNRDVTIVFDSDAATNPGVVRAQLALSAELTARGAVPKIASLPAADDGSKQGLDDYLVRHGSKALEEVLAKAEPLQEAEALWQMNSEVAYIVDPGLVLVRDTGQKMKSTDFIYHAFSDRHYIHSEMTPKGPKTEKRPLANRWMEWEQRFKLKRITYSPGQAPITAGGEWNQWTGWGCEPVPGDLGPWNRLLDYVFRDNYEARQWFERWCAYPLQHPGTKMFTSVVMWSVHQGTGKTLLGYTLRNIYGDNATEIKDQHLHAGFNEWAENKQFVIGDEVTSRSEKRNEADHIKGMITNEFVRINTKYVPSYVVPDCINYFFTSNNPDAFFLEDTDRRFFIWEIVGRPAALTLYNEYDKWLKSGGAKHLFDYLLKLDLGDFNPRSPALITNAKRAMIVDNKSDLAMWVHQLKDDPKAALAQLGSGVAVADCDLFSTEQLHHCYDPEGKSSVTVNGLARELKRGGFRQVNEGSPVRTAAKLMRLYAVRNADVWAKAEPHELVAHWNKYFAGGKY